MNLIKSQNAASDRMRSCNPYSFPAPPKRNLMAKYQRPDGIAPHGGELINRIATPEQKADLLNKSEGQPSITLDDRALSDLQMIAIGGFSPLTGFMTQADYDSEIGRAHV